MPAMENSNRLTKTLCRQMAQQRLRSTVVDAQAHQCRCNGKVNSRAAMLQSDKAAQLCCSEKMCVVVGDGHYGNRVDRAQSIVRTEYARGGATMEEVGRGIQICDDDGDR